MDIIIETNPAYYGLSTRIKLEQLDENQIGIRKVVKSRIIQKDAHKVIAIVRKIKSVHPQLGCTLICTHNICSKSIKLLEGERISLLFVED